MKQNRYPQMGHSLAGETNVSVPTVMFIQVCKTPPAHEESRWLGLSLETSGEASPERRLLTWTGL